MASRRWKPKEVARLYDLKDDAEFPVKLTILGNQEDPLGNPIPYERMTQRGSHVRRDAIRYRRWQEFVRSEYLRQVRKSFPQVPNGRYVLHCHVAFRCPSGNGGCSHADPDNVRKGIQDALFFMGDQHVTGGVTMEHSQDRPRVDIHIEPWAEAEGIQDEKS